MCVGIVSEQKVKRRDGILWMMVNLIYNQFFSAVSSIKNQTSCLPFKFTFQAKKKLPNKVIFDGLSIFPFGRISNFFTNMICYGMNVIYNNLFIAF